ncbi:MAG TPA: RsmB/NOP family class I SAM-dependent RNA methyltransferase [Sphingomicrobium sp.]|nr:RsmB/NOP family class I SAM-dependent RNA methyltransferase [Sphingomicrobium sp.]
MNGPKPSIEGLAPRRAALTILDRVLRSGQTVESAAQSAGKLPPPELAFTLAIVGETLRRLPELDSLIDGTTRDPLPDDSKARMVLRLALAQKLALTVPDHAIVATALPLVDGGPRRLVHGVLGTLLRRGLAASDSPPLPADVEQRWARAWGEEVVAAARRAIVRRPPLDLSFATDDAAAAFAGRSGGESLLSRHVRLSGGAGVIDLPGFQGGEWWVQDIAASLPGRLVPAGADTVLDACAAPGGKTMQLAAAGHRVLALDRSANRLKRLEENLGRTGLSAETLVADAFAWECDRTFDAVLLDAPCSATGTFRRHPEVLYRVRQAFIAQAAEGQRKLLDRARAWLKPGGALVYSVCSLEPQEGEAVIAEFLTANPDFRVDPPAPLADWLQPTEAGFLRILPGMLESDGGLDGFFVARLVAKA